MITAKPPQIMIGGWTGSTNRLAKGDTTDTRPKV
jgi:hypothetical protein